jgi:hydroxyacylglutathione hydrolase
MTLEDHLGDIIHKARLSANVSRDEIARVAGLSAEAVAELEESGQFSQPPNFEALGKLLELDPAKLEGLAQGWTPAPVELSRWCELRQITTTEHRLAVNCFLIWDEVTRDAALFDTGWDAQPVLELIRENELQLRHIFITHTHTDHLAALPAVREQFPKVRLHSSSKSAPLDQRNRANDFIHLGSLRITNRDTPGHAEDGVTYVVGNWPEDAPHAAMVGDAIFAGSIGGAREHAGVAKQKIREQIFSLPAETLICPGHGPLTTVGEEKAHNPFFTAP